MTTGTSKAKREKKIAGTAAAVTAAVVVAAAAAASGFGLQWLLSRANSFPANQSSEYEKAYCWRRSSPLRMGRITAAPTSTNKRPDQWRIELSRWNPAHGYYLSTKHAKWNNLALPVRKFPSAFGTLHLPYIATSYLRINQSLNTRYLHLYLQTYQIITIDSLIGYSLNVTFNSGWFWNWLAITLLWTTLYCPQHSTNLRK